MSDGRGLLDIADDDDDGAMGLFDHHDHRKDKSDRHKELTVPRIRMHGISIVEDGSSASASTKTSSHSKRGGPTPVSDLKPIDNWKKKTCFSFFFFFFTFVAVLEGRDSYDASSCGSGGSQVGATEKKDPIALESIRLDSQFVSVEDGKTLRP